MAKVNMPWFRLYSEILDDRKLKRITRTTRNPKALVLGTWVTLLALASQSDNRGRLEISAGMPYEFDDLIDETGLEPESLQAILEAMISQELVTYDREALTYEITNWDERQFESDSSTERTRKYRARKKQDQPSQETEGNVTGTSQERHRDALDTDTDTESDKDKDKELISTHANEKNQESQKNQEGSINASHVPSIGTTGDELDKFIQVYETTMGEKILPYPGLVILVNEMKQEGVTPEIYRDALLGLKANGYTVSNMGSAKNWAIKDAREKRNPKTTNARRNGNGLYLESMSAKWNEKSRKEKIESLEYMRANNRIKPETEQEAIRLGLIKETK